MSTLAWTAQLVRISSRAFEDIAKDVPVFAQLLVGGRGVLLVDRLDSPAVRLRLVADGASSELDLLRAGLVIVEPDLVPEPMAEAATRWREARDEDIVLSAHDVRVLSDAARELRIALHVTEFAGGLTLDESQRGQWEFAAARSPGYDRR